jgi:hypothetical protein
MAQQGDWMMVPAKITGAATTDFDKYIGATKGGKDGAARYILCFNSNSSASIAAGAVVTISTASASSAFEPFIVAATSGNGVVGHGFVDESARPNGLLWVQIAGLRTITVVSSAGARSAYANAWAQTDTSNVYQTAALTTAFTTGASTDPIKATFAVGPLQPKFLVNARFVAASATTAVAMIVDRGFQTIATT